MRLAALSDIHGNLAALEAVERDFQRRGVDRVINLGDHLSGPLLPRETADFLMTRDWLHIAGNHERQLLDGGGGPSDAHARTVLTPEHRAWMASLPTVQRLDGDVLLCHGTPRSDREHLLATVTTGGLVEAGEGAVRERLRGWPCHLLLCGHTHLPRSLRLPEGTLVVNPGSVGLQAYVDDDPCPYRVESGSPHARYAILERHRGAWTVEPVQVAYDVEPMAELARERGFTRWEHALRTGRLETETRDGVQP